MFFLIIVKSRREILWTLVFVISGLAFGAAVHFTPIFKTFGQKGAKDITVIVDAGHGLPDGGTVGVGGTIEQEINLSVAQKLCEVLEGKGIGVIMTRTGENCLCDEQEGKTLRQIKKEDMNNRLEIIKKSNAALFVSVHMNYFNSQSAKGLRLFYAANHGEIKLLAENIQSRMSDVTGAKMYAVKTADKNLFLMKNPPIPAILIECGFLSNIEEEKKLNDDDYQSRIAWAIADAVEKYYR